MPIRTNRGFTIIELVFVTIALGLLSAAVLPSFICARSAAKEEEVKNNIHIIQMALERYGTDHHKKFPAMIWGGDKQGWSTKKDHGCRTMWEHEVFNGENEEDAVPPDDPLIKFGYLESYPRNPFMGYGDGLKYTIKWTGPAGAEIGCGDVRFGFDGEKMGNILEDPKYLWKGPGQPTRIKNTFCDKAHSGCAGMLNPNLPGNPFYAMGGIPPWPEEGEEPRKSYNPDRHGTQSAYWPGEFFYRSRGIFDLPLEFTHVTSKTKDPNMRFVWDFKYSAIVSYVIGGYGALETRGMDIIRLTDENGRVVNNLSGYSENCFYEPNPIYPRTSSTRIHFSSPEIQGGGHWGTMPIFPNVEPEGLTSIWGSADGFRDGVIFATTENASLVLEWDEKRGIITH